MEKNKERFPFRMIPNILDFEIQKTKSAISQSDSFLVDFNRKFNKENFLPDSLGHFNFLNEFISISKPCKIFAININYNRFHSTFYILYVTTSMSIWLACNSMRLGHCLI